MPDCTDKLTPKARLFVEAYLGACRFNATRSAIQAGYSAKTAYSIGFDLLKKPEIQAALKERLDAAAMTADEVLSRLADHARVDIADFLKADKNGSVRVALDLTKAAKAGKTHLIKSLKPGEFGAEITLVDSQSALVQLGRHHGLFKDRVEQVGEGLEMLRQFLAESPDGENGDATES